MRIIELMIWHRGHLVIMCKARIFMLKRNWCSEVRNSALYRA
jgi:hypothetical protein